jgi:hypothetical protein
MKAVSVAVERKSFGGEPVSVGADVPSVGVEFMFVGGRSLVLARRIQKREGLSFEEVLVRALELYLGETTEHGG